MNNIEHYIESIPEQRRARFMLIHKRILKLYPDAIVDMSYRMPTYRHGEGWIALANQKNYISLYTCAESHIETYKNRHPQQKTGKGCINFRARDEIVYDDLDDVIRHAIESSGHSILTPVE
ncbi:MAG: DUF1801 domain-containing protein [Gammaproteobacteria bacterium]|nr:DUF1801 domain-containing protein [Gammaproteobacteria bacterium]